MLLTGMKLRLTKLSDEMLLRASKLRRSWETLPRLSLNGWPPLASHLAFLLLGLSISHLGSQTKPFHLKIMPQTVALNLGKKTSSTQPRTRFTKSQGASFKSDALDLKPGEQVVMLKQEMGHADCLLHATPLIVLEGEPEIIVGLPVADASDLKLIWQALATQAFRLSDVHASAGVPRCERVPKVTYGFS